MVVTSKVRSTISLGVKWGRMPSYMASGTCVSATSVTAFVQASAARSLAVTEKRGFAPSRQGGQPACWLACFQRVGENACPGKSVALLEERMGVRLTQRSTRRLSLTEAGRVFHEHCAAMLVEAEAAQQAVEPLRAAPSGTVRMTCPVAMAQFYVARIVAGFMREYPRVRIEIGSTDRVVNRIVNRIDVALRARYAGLEDPGLVARRIASGRIGGRNAGACRPRMEHARAGHPPRLPHPPGPAARRAGADWLFGADDTGCAGRVRCECRCRWFSRDMCPRVRAIRLAHARIRFTARNKAAPEMRLGNAGDY